MPSLFGLVKQPNYSVLNKLKSSNRVFFNIFVGREICKESITIYRLQGDLRQERGSDFLHLLELKTEFSDPM